MWFRRKPFRWLCPYCGNCFFNAEVGLARRRNRLPHITSMIGAVTCTDCGLMTSYDDFVRQQRGWL